MRSRNSAIPIAVSLHRYCHSTGLPVVMLDRIADGSLIVLAAKYQTTRLLTLDERHFRAIRPLHAVAFTLLPADG